MFPSGPEHLEHSPLQRGRRGVRSIRSSVLSETAVLRRHNLLSCGPYDLRQVHPVLGEA